MAKRTTERSADALVRIKRAVLAGRYAFSEKARLEMEADGLSGLDVAGTTTMFRITACPSCGTKIKKVRRNWTGNFKGKTYTVPNLEYCKCPGCGEKVYGRDAMRKIEAHSPAFQRTHPKRRSAPGYHSGDTSE